MILASPTLLVIKGLCPLGVLDRLPSKLMERLAEKCGAKPPEVRPGHVATSLDDRGNAGEGEQVLAVFIPIGFMPGVGGQWFKPFALTIAASVFVSLFVSFSLDPMLSAYWADPQTESHERRNPIARNTPSRCAGEPAEIVIAPSRVVFSP